MFEKNKNLNSTLSLKLLNSFGRFQKYIKLDIKINTDLPQDKNVIFIKINMIRNNNGFQLEFA